MARNLVTVSEVVNDFILSLDSDDYANNVSDTMVHNYALRGIRDMGFDMLERIRSIKLEKASNDTVELQRWFALRSRGEQQHQHLTEIQEGWYIKN